MAASKTKKQSIPTVTIPEVPEVGTFLALDARVREVRAASQAFFDQYDVLVKQRNEALEEAKAACRQKEVSCGPIVWSHAVEKVDWEKLAGALGNPQAFLSIGGRMDTVTKYTGDVELLKVAAAGGKVNNGLLDAVTSRSLTIDSSTPKVIGS